MMKTWIKVPYRILIKPVLRIFKLDRKFPFLVQLVLAYVYDFHRYFTWSKTGVSNWNRAKLTANIYELSHSIEKGLALRNTKIEFGQEKIQKLLFFLNLYYEKYGFDILVSMAVEVLNQYVQFHQHCGIFITDIEKSISRFQKAALSHSEDNIKEINTSSCSQRGGAYILSRDEILQQTRGGFEDVVLARHSVRMFADSEVDFERIRRSIQLAQHSPSSCNRQAWQVRVFSDPEEILKLLTIQRGARGFIEEVPSLLLVTMDLQYWDNANERYQAYIDGGMFAMTLVHALTAQGLATCCLNLSLEPQRDKALRRATNIPPSEVFIMMIAAGEYPSKFAVTVSHRRDTSEVCLTPDFPEIAVRQ